MASKTISIDADAYRRLLRAREFGSESFSSVIKRATWPEPPRTAGALLDAIKALPPLDISVLDRLEQAQHENRSPEDVPRSTPRS